jgi:hypothetical protein
MGSDMEHYRMLYIITDNDGTINLYGFTRENLIDLTELVHELKSDTTIVPFFSPADKTEFILYNKDTGEARVYTHHFDQKNDFILTLTKTITLNTPALVTG